MGVKKVLKAITSPVRAVAGAVGLGAPDMSGALKAQARAAQAQADRARSAADQAFNRDNPNRPDTGSLLAQAARAGALGSGSTLLTGPSGVDPNELQLGRNTMLGR